MKRIAIASMAFDEGSGELFGPHANVRLEPKAAAVLAALYHAGGGVLSRQALLDECWGEGQGSDEALTQAVAQIRKALEQAGRAGLIETLAKRGYRLNLPDKPAARSPAVSSEAHVVVPGRHRVPRLLWASALLLVALFAAWVTHPHALRHAIRHTFGWGTGVMTQHAPPIRRPAAPAIPPAT